MCSCASRACAHQQRPLVWLHTDYCASRACTGHVPTKRLHSHKLRKMIMHAEQELRDTESVLAVSKTLNKDTEPSMKVCDCRSGRTSACLQKFSHVELRTFRLVGGWDLLDPSNRRLFLKLAQDEMRSRTRSFCLQRALCGHPYRSSMLRNPRATEQT